MSAPTESAAAKAALRPKVSLCMIVKNEEKNIGACLACCADLVNEIIVVDTGSTDRTKEIALQAGAKVFDFPWPNSFAIARNESKKHATGEWIFWMDADDRIDEENREKLRQLFAGLVKEKAAYTMKVKVLPGDPADPIRMVDHGRLFKNNPKFWWTHRVHEQILPAVTQHGGVIRRTDIVITHVGYTDVSLRPQKQERNLKLLALDVQDHPDDAFTLYNMARLLDREKKFEEALPMFRKALAKADKSETFVRKVYWLMAQVYHKLGQRAQVLQTCLAGLTLFPDECEMLFLVGSLLHENGELLAAEAALQRVLATPPSLNYYELGDDVSLRTYKAHTQLARIYHDQKRFQLAEKHYQAALETAPEFEQALLGFGQLLVEKQRWTELDEVVQHLDTLGVRGQSASAVLRGLRFTALKQYDEAERLMSATVEQYPDLLEARILLSRLVWRDRTRKPQVVRQVLEGILKLDPSHVEARRQLQKLATESAPLPGTGVNYTT